MNAAQVTSELLEQGGGFASPDYYRACSRIERIYHDPLWLIEGDGLSTDPFAPTRSLATNEAPTSAVESIVGARTTHPQE